MVFNADTIKALVEGEFARFFKFVNEKQSLFEQFLGPLFFV